MGIFLNLEGKYGGERICISDIPVIEKLYLLDMFRMVISLSLVFYRKNYFKSTLLIFLKTFFLLIFCKVKKKLNSLIRNRFFIVLKNI